MKLIRNLIYVLVAIAMLALGALFAVQNEATVPVDLLVVTLPERSVALWILSAFALGGVLGMVISLGMILRLRAALHAARRKLDRQSRTPEPAVAQIPAPPRSVDGS